LAFGSGFGSDLGSDFGLALGNTPMGSGASARVLTSRFI
jgi:hypothetical protein